MIAVIFQSLGLQRSSCCDSQSVSLSLSPSVAAPFSSLSCLFALLTLSLSLSLSLGLVVSVSSCLPLVPGFVSQSFRDHLILATALEFAVTSDTELLQASYTRSWIKTESSCWCASAASHVGVIIEFAVVEMSFLVPGHVVV